MIKHVVTRGFGNGTFSGEIARVVTRGYGVGEALAPAATASWAYVIFAGNKGRASFKGNKGHVTTKDQ